MVNTSTNEPVMNNLEEISPDDFSLVWSHLRNLVDFDTVEIPNDIALTGTALGMFPVNSFHPIYLEVPRNRKKQDISGRANFRGPNSTNRIDWRFIRVVSLPIYKVANSSMSIDCFKSLFQSWRNSLIPEDIPCLALAINLTGRYCDEREGQYAVVLLVWPDNATRLLELDWFEGPLEDCITPEWYIRSSEWLSFETAFIKLKNICSNSPFLKNPIFSMFLNPSCLGSGFQGEKAETNSSCWEYEWIYYDQADLIKDLELILEKIEQILVV
ncbi:MAG: hypothetical protein JSV05_09000 [Candidatus Bathyarchaeota archaeon]|nr:MAG: hypothetical protein JSV05_09000 [Candidatus Bathyarchaeota archaeon]